MADDDPPLRLPHLDLPGGPLPMTPEEQRLADLYGPQARGTFQHLLANVQSAPGLGTFWEDLKTHRAPLIDAVREQRLGSYLVDEGEKIWDAIPKPWENPDTTQAVLDTAALPAKAAVGMAKGIGSIMEAAVTNPTVETAADAAFAVAGVGGGLSALGVGAKQARSLGMFVGRNAENADLSKLATAEKMALKGHSREEIYDQTGWFRWQRPVVGPDGKRVIGPDGKPVTEPISDWRFETPDADSYGHVNPEVLTETGQTKVPSFPLEKIFEHPKLAKAYSGRPPGAMPVPAPASGVTSSGAGMAAIMKQRLELRAELKALKGSGLDVKEYEAAYQKLQARDKELLDEYIVEYNKDNASVKETELEPVETPSSAGSATSPPEWTETDFEFGNRFIDTSKLERPIMERLARKVDYSGSSTAASYNPYSDSFNFGTLPGNAAKDGWVPWDKKGEYTQKLSDEVLAKNRKAADKVFKKAGLALGSDSWEWDPDSLSLKHRKTGTKLSKEEQARLFETTPEAEEAWRLVHKRENTFYEKDDLALTRFRGSALHELQHAIQAREGWQGGGNTKMFGKGGPPRYQGNVKDPYTGARLTNKEKYYRLLGEIEARLADRRKDLPDAERYSVQKRPWTREGGLDRLESQAIVEKDFADGGPVYGSSIQYMADGGPPKLPDLTSVPGGKRASLVPDSEASQSTIKRRLVLEKQALGEMLGKPVKRDVTQWHERGIAKLLDKDLLSGERAKKTAQRIDDLKDLVSGPMYPKVEEGRGEVTSIWEALDLPGNSDAQGISDASRLLSESLGNTGGEGFRPVFPRTLEDAWKLIDDRTKTPDNIRFLDEWLKQNHGKGLLELTFPPDLPPPPSPVLLQYIPPGEDPPPPETILSEDVKKRILEVLQPQGPNLSVVPEPEPRPEDPSNLPALISEAATAVQRTLPPADESRPKGQTGVGRAAGIAGGVLRRAPIGILAQAAQLGYERFLSEEQKAAVKEFLASPAHEFVGMDKPGIEYFKDLFGMSEDSPRPTATPASENVGDVASGYAVHGRVVGNQDVSIDSLYGGVSAAVGEQERVNELVDQIRQSGEISRLIIDQDNNVIEGAHRLEALRKMGVDSVPVVRIEDMASGMPVAEIREALKEAGLRLHPDQVNRLISNVLEATKEVGSASEAKAQFEPPAGFEKAWTTALDVIAGAELPMDQASRMARPTDQASNVPKLRRDNPGGEWLEIKLQDAQERRQEYRDKGNLDSIYATVGGTEGVTGWGTYHLNPQDLVGIKGAMREERTIPGEKLRRLKKSISEEGYSPNSILMVVREDGVPFVTEGNNRLAEAIESGRPSIEVELKYLRGAEDVDGRISPDKLPSMIVGPRPTNKARGGFVDKPLYDNNTIVGL